MQGEDLEAEFAQNKRRRGTTLAGIAVDDVFLRLVVFGHVLAQRPADVVLIGDREM
jgi:hypothetical protein